MAPVQDTQLEKVLDGALECGNVQALNVFLQRATHEDTQIKCSQQFLSKVDKLVNRSLDQKDPKSASSGLGILYKCGKNLKVPAGSPGLSGLIAQGLVKKWFEKCRQLWVQCGLQWDETLFNLSEDFFDALMVVHEACKEGTCEVTELFVYSVGQLAVDPRIYILIQKEAIRKFNLILDKIPVELKKKRKILASQEASDIMIKIAGQIMEGGDYDLQTALTEALCRMATPEQRKDLADRWFSMAHVASAFVKISDSEFETDCRKFLNLVNGMQGDKRRVYSYPCLEVYLGKNELLMPTDDKLEEFWIDFNLGSHSISFYFSLADEDVQGQWETICINDNEVQTYSVEEKGRSKVLQVKLSEVVVVGSMEGSSLSIHFSSSVDILHAAQSVYGHSKNTGFVGKTGTSVVKTTVKILMEENSSQVVSESQMSLVESEKSTAPYLLPAPSAPVQIAHVREIEDFNLNVLIAKAIAQRERQPLLVNPGRMRMSESTSIITGSAGGSVCGTNIPFAALPSNTPAKDKVKKSLQMVRSCERQSDCYLGELRTTAKTNIQSMTHNGTGTGSANVQATKNKVVQQQKKMNTKTADKTAAAQEAEQALEQMFVPDTQPSTGGNISSCWSKMSVSEVLIMPTQKMKSLPKPEPHSVLAQQQEPLSLAQSISVPVNSPISQKKLHAELTERLQQVLNERNQGCIQSEPTALQRITSDTRGRSFEESLVSKVQNAKKVGLANQKNKRQTSLEIDTASTARAPLEKLPPNVKFETKKAVSVKEKKDSAAAGNMVKLISSHYDKNTITTAKDSAEKIPQSWFQPPNFNRQVFNMSWFSTAKRKESGYVNVTNLSKATMSLKRQREDIFSFIADEPLRIGGKDKTLNKTFGMSSSDINDSSEFPRITNKGQQVVKEKRHVKKHLFSDTDTDYAMTEVSWLRESSRKPKPKVTKYSRQPNTKPKAASPRTSCEFSDEPQPSKKHVKGNSRPQNRKPDMKERAGQPKTTVKPAAAPKGTHAAGRRPKRAAATSAKSYREVDTDDSQSESEKPPASKQLSPTDHLENEAMKNKADSKKSTNSFMTLESFHHINLSVSEQTHSPKTTAAGVRKTKDASSYQPTDTYRRLESKKQSYEKKISGHQQPRCEMTLSETSKLNKKTATAFEEQKIPLKKSGVTRQASYPSSPFMERMRSAERSAPTLGLTCSPLLSPRGSPLPTSPDPPCRDTPSPILLLAKPRSTASSKGNLKTSSFYSARKIPSLSKMPSIQSLQSVHSLTPRLRTPASGAPSGKRAAEISPIQKFPPPSPTHSPLPLYTQPLLTSTQLDLEKPCNTSPPQSPLPGDTINHYSFSEVSSISHSQSSTKSFIHTRKVEESPSVAHVMSFKAEKTPSSDDQMPPQLHVSGPSRKRHISLSSNSEEYEKEVRKKCKRRGNRSPMMKPRKLFKSYSKIIVESEGSQIMSPSHTISSSHWEAQTRAGDMDMEEDFDMPKMAVNMSNLCQQFSTELKKKFQNRHKMVEVYNKQSLKTFQHHVSSLNMQVTKHRTEELEQVQAVLLEEIHKLEQDETGLKNMEKDLTMYWKKQITSFRSFHEQEIRRNETLGKALQTNMCPSLEYEEKIFTSQMCLIRKDMKSVQDRLLTQMQEGEIQSVKRGLHALFFP